MSTTYSFERADLENAWRLVEAEIMGQCKSGLSPIEGARASYGAALLASHLGLPVPTKVRDFYRRKFQDSAPEPTFRTEETS